MPLGFARPNTKSRVSGSPADLAPSNGEIDLVGLFARQRIAPERLQDVEDLLDRLSNNIRSSDWPKHRDYAFATMAVDCTALGDRDEPLRRDVGALIDLHWQLQIRRWETGKLKDDMDWRCLAMAAKKLERHWRTKTRPADPRLRIVISSAVDRTTPDHPGRVLSNRDLIRDWKEKLKFRARLWSYSRKLKRAGAKSDTDDKLVQGMRELLPWRLSGLEPLLLQMMLGTRSQRHAAARIVCDKYLERSTGLFLQKPIGHERKLFYTRPLLLLALILFAEQERIPILPLSGRMAEELPSVSSFDSSISGAIAFLCAWDEAMKSPPELPVSWGPGPPTLEAAHADMLVKGVLTRSGFRFKTFDPLPENVPFVVSVRHDVDRELQVSELEEIERFECDLGLNATWFFKPETYDKNIAKDLLARGCEIGWHCSDARTADDGFAHRLLDDFGDAIVGVSFHGGFGAFYWQGRSTLTRIAQLGFRYAEWPADVFVHPRPWPWRSTGIYLTPSGVKIQSRPEFFREHRDFLVRSRGHIIVENHPDRFDDKTRHLIEELVAMGGLRRTIAEHVEACRAADAMAHAANNQILTEVAEL